MSDTKFNIGPDQRAKAAQDRALEASADLRAEREAVNLQIETLRAKARALSEQILVVERKARNGD